MKALLLFVLMGLVATEYSEPAYSSDRVPITEFCRDALFPLAGVRYAGKSSSMESLTICLKDPGTSAVAYQIYTNGRKAFSVTPVEAKSFSVYMSNTYSVNCSDPRVSGDTHSATAPPKRVTADETDTSKHLCAVTATIHNQPVRAAFSFDKLDGARDRAIFELAYDEGKALDESKQLAGEPGNSREETDPIARKSPCKRNYEPDGSSTDCFRTFTYEYNACPDSEKTCFDPAVVGAWIVQTHETARESKLEQLIPHVHGLIIRPDRSVRRLAVDFKTGKPVEGEEIPSFLRVFHACDGSMYQSSHGFAQGSHGVYCGRYVFEGTSLGISQTNTGAYRYYDPVEIGKPLIEPIQFDFASNLEDKPFPIAHTGTKVPAYAVVNGQSVRFARIQATFGRGLDGGVITISLPELSQPGKYTGANAGSLWIGQNTGYPEYSVKYSTKKDDADSNEIVIDLIDLKRGRVAGKFSYAVFEESKKRKESKRVTGKFDLPLYIYIRDSKSSSTN